jgi:hypothetical protein
VPESAGNPRSLPRSNELSAARCRSLASMHFTIAKDFASLTSKIKDERIYHGCPDAVSKGWVTLEEAADCLLIEASAHRRQKAKSNRRLKTLCSALQQEQNLARIREIKIKLSQEFYHGGQGQ